MRLVRESTRMLGRGSPEVFEGDSATAVLEAMRRDDPYFNAMTPREFRVTLLDMTGADPGPNATDDEFLRAIVEASPALRLEQGGSLSRLAR